MPLIWASMVVPKETLKKAAPTALLSVQKPAHPIDSLGLDCLYVDTSH